MGGALSFLTAFGRVRPGAAPRPDGRSLRWFPVVGALIGLALGGLWWCLVKAWSAPVAAGIVVAADLAITGLLHLDGLADSADGLLPPMTRQRRLEVMRDPSTGAFAVGVVVVTLLARFAVFATLRPAPLLVGALWCLSRTGMATVIGRVPYARDLPPDDGDGADGATTSGGGLASAFMGHRLPLWAAGLAISASISVATLWSFPAGTVAAASAVVAFAAVVWLGVRRVGGFTGDVLGAAGVVGETVGLLVAAAKW
jgi:adenosylcobinamide-GDP ribazoletransferase